MLQCPTCGDTNPENLSLYVTLGGCFLNDLLADQVSLLTIKEYLLDTLYQERSLLDCNACGYRGPSERDRVERSDDHSKPEP